MPRHRVREEDRRRSVRACEACRLSRKRCDSKIPCACCKRRGLADKCTYGNARASSVGLQRRGDGLTSTHTNHQANEPAQSLSVAQQHARILFTSRGEKVYVGNTAAISMLEFLRNTLRQFSGPSAFTESRRSNIMLEATVRSYTNTDSQFVDYLDKHERAALTHVFSVASSGFLSLLPDRLLRYLESADEPEPDDPINQDDLAAVYLVIAIGARCRGKDENDARCSATYFAEAQRINFQDLLMDPSMTMTRNFVLMAFYMFCACRRNTALLYLGVASRAATILGLHLPELNASLAVESRCLRVRTWKSLRVLDLLCNAILGRPSSTPGVVTDDIDAPVTHGRMAVNANYESCAIIEAISKKLTDDNSLDLATAEGFLGQLRDWAQSLPDQLRRSIGQANTDFPNQQHQQVTMGNVHVAGSYYFGVFLTTRQFLVAEVVTALHQRHHTVPSPSPVNDKVKELSRVCVDAATMLSQMCYDAGASNLLLGNMCILQAWILAAGLIIGLSILKQPEILSSEVRQRLSSSQDVLCKLSKLSPQAQRYSEILSDFAAAIEQYGEKSRQTHRHASSFLLEQILRPRIDVTDSSITSALPSPIPSNQDCASMAGDASLWPQSGIMGVVPDITDEVGFQLLWDEYIYQPNPQTTSLDEADGRWSGSLEI